MPFELAGEAFEWSKAHIVQDLRRDYGEKRLLAFAPMRGRLHVICYCIRGDVRRIISFHKANAREEKLYAEEKTASDR